MARAGVSLAEARLRDLKEKENLVDDLLEKTRRCVLRPRDGGGHDLLCGVCWTRGAAAGGPHRHEGERGTGLSDVEVVTRLVASSDS